MPRVTIPGVGDLNFPDNMSRDEIMQRATAIQQQAQQPIFDPRDMGATDLIKGGFARGIESLKGTAFDLVPALGAAIIGKDGFAKEQLKEYKDRMTAAEELNPTAYKSYKEIEGIGDAFKYGAETFGELGPDIVSFMLGTGVGTTAGKAIAKKGLEKAVATQAAEYATKKGLTKEAELEYAERLLSRAKEGMAGAKAAREGADVGMKTGLWGSSLGLNVPDTFNQIYEDTGDLRPGIALTIGPLVAALDTYLPGKMLKQLGPAGKERIAAAMLEKSTIVPTTWKKAFGAEVLKTTGGEALTEGGQQVLQNLASQMAGDKEGFFSEKNIDSIINSALKGAIGGTVYGAPGAAVEAKRIKGESQQQFEQRQIAAQEQARKEAEAKAMAEYQAGVPAQQATGDLFGMPPQQGPVPDTSTVAEREAAAAQAAAGQEVPTRQPIGGAQGSLNFEQNLLGFTPGVPGAGGTVNLEPISVSREGVARTAEQAAQERMGQLEPQTPQQMDLFPTELGVAEAEQLRGIPQPKTVEENAGPEQAPAEFATVLDAALLKRTGLKPQSGFFKQLLGKDVANPEDQPSIGEVLVNMESNPNLSQSTKDSVNMLIGQIFGALGQQQEMIGPRGGITKEADYGRAAQRAFRETNRVSPAVPVERGTAPAEGAVASEAEGVARAEPPVEEPRVGEGEPYAPLSQEEQDALQAELQAELGAEQPAAVPTPVVQPEVVQQAATPQAGQAAVPQVAPTGGLPGVSAPTTAPAIQPAPQAATTKKAKKQAAPKATEAVEKKTKPAEGSAEWQELAKPGTSEFVVSKGYLGFIQEDVSNPDDLAMFAIIKNDRGPLSNEAKAAQTYFNKMGRVVDNLLNIAFDLAFNTPRFRAENESTAEANFFRGMDGKNARLASEWIYKNFTEGTQDIFRNMVRRFELARDAYSDRQLMQLIMSGLSGKSETMTDETVKSYLEAMAEENSATQSPKVRKILDDAVFRMGQVLHPAIIASLQGGDFTTALNMLAANSDPLVARTAARLAETGVNSKVVVRTGLKDETGRSVPGFYDPKTNTIHLDSTTGMNPHVILHEAGHATTSHVLDNPSHPLTRQLQQLLDAVRDSLGTAYGTTDVHEFASEAMSNQEFVGQLQSINPNGGVYSAWDIFKRAVTNFFRRLVGLEGKPLASAYDEADRILSSILSPSPESRDAGALYAPSVNKSKNIFSKTDTLINAVPFMSNQQRDALSAGIAGGSKFVRSAIFSLLPTHALGEIADSVFPGLGTKFHQYINERSGYENKLNRGTDAAVGLAKKAIAQRPGQRDEYNKIVNESTINEIDPTKPRSEYAKDPEALKAWEELNKRYNRLDSVWKNLYVTMRDAYKQMYEEIKDAINSRIDSTDLDGKTKALIKQDIMARLAEKGMIDPYFALGREGDYWLAADYTDKNGQKQFTVEAFTSPNARSRRMQDIVAQDKEARVDAYANIGEINYRRAPTGSFVNSVLKIMETNGVPEQAIDEMMRLFITTLPETAFAQSFQKRKGTAGFMEDSIGVFEKKMRNMSHQVANMRYNPKLSGVVDQMRLHTEMVGRGLPKGETDAMGNEVKADIPARDNQLEKDYVQEFEKHMKYVLNPTKHDIGSILASTAFTYTLGFNLSSAVVNMANVPMIVAPYLKGKYGTANVAGAIGNASKVFLGSGTNAEMPVIGADGKTTMMKVMPSIANYAPNSAMGKKYATLIQVANDRGQLNRSQLYELIQGDTRTGLISKLNAMSGWIFHHGERMNREVTMMASYDLEMQKLKDDIRSGKMTQQEAELQAANNAVYTAELTNGSIAAASAPRIAQNPLGKLLFMYKRYGVSMYYMMFKTAKEALKSESPEVRKAAWRQLGGIVGMSALMAGVQGVPLFGLATMVYSAFCDEDDDDLPTVTRKSLGEFLYKGPVEYMTNLAIASRMTLSDLIIRDNKGGQSAGTFSQQMAIALGGPFVGVADRIQRGLSKINEGHIQRGMEDILPSFIANPLKAYRYATEGTQTLRGDPITGDVNAWNVGAQFFGFAPADYTRQLEINSKEKGVDKFLAQKASKLKQHYFLAKRVNDPEGMMDARDKLLEIGLKHPGLGITPGTITDILSRSMKAQERATKEMVHGVRYSKKMLKEIQADMAEYE